MTPPKLTDEQIQGGVEQAVKAKKLSWLGFKKDDDGKYTVPVMSPSNYQFAHAIAALRDQQWAEMLAGQEPVAYLHQWKPGAPIIGKKLLWTAGSPYGDKVQVTPLYTHPAPDHTAVMRQALEALSDFDYDKRIAAISALKQALGEQP